MYYSAALLMLVMMAFAVIPSTADTVNAVSYWPQASSLYQGQTSSYLVTVDCGALLTLISPDNGNYYLYAMRSRGFTPTDSYVMNNADLVANGYGQTKTLTLDQGQWYLVIYAQSGYGQYQLTKQDTCSKPDPCYGNPNCGGGGTSCQPKYTNTQSGVLQPGQSNVYGYSIGGRRSAIEWILRSSDCSSDIPIVMMSADQVSSFRRVTCGSNIELYIYKDCMPGSCNAFAADTSSASNAYVRVSNPTSGSVYYAQVFVRNGSGRVSYQLTCRSYDCNSYIIPMSGGTETPIQMMSTAQDIPSPDPNPPQPISVGN